MRNEKKIKEFHFVPGFLLGMLFGAIVMGALCWTGPIEGRDNIINELNTIVMEQAKKIDTLQAAK